MAIQTLKSNIVTMDGETRIEIGVNEKIPINVRRKRLTSASPMCSKQKKNEKNNEIHTLTDPCTVS